MKNEANMKRFFCNVNEIGEHLNSRKGNNTERDFYSASSPKYFKRRSYDLLPFSSFPAQ